MPVVAVKKVFRERYLEAQIVALAFAVTLPPGVSLPVSSR